MLGRPGELLQNCMATAVNADPWALLIAFDSNYEHLCLPENTIHPAPGGKDSDFVEVPRPHGLRVRKPPTTKTRSGAGNAALEGTLVM